MDVPPHFVKRLNDLWHIHGDVAAEAKVLLQAWRCVGLMLEHKVAYAAHHGPAHQVEAGMRRLAPHALRSELEQGARPLVRGQHSGTKASPWPCMPAMAEALATSAI